MEELGQKERLFYLEEAKKQRKQLYYTLPGVFRNRQQEDYDKLWQGWQSEKPDGLLLRNIDEFAWLREKVRHGELWENCEVILDHSLYAYNREASLVYEEWMGPFSGRLTRTYPVELNKKELRPLAGAGRELVVYGRLALMVSAQCVAKNTKGCTGEPGYTKLSDRCQKDFYVKRHCGNCYNTIFNGVPMSLYGAAADFPKAPSSVRLHFTVENKDEADRMIRLFYEEWNHARDDRRVRDTSCKSGKDQGKSVHREGGLTWGHYKRGVE